MRILAAAAVAMLLAGCAGEANDPTTAATRTATTGAGTTPGTPSAPPLRMQEFPVDYTGEVAASACIPDSPSSCSGASGPGDTSDTTIRQPGTLRWNGTLTLTWAATTPTTEALRFNVMPYRACGTSCAESAGSAQGVAGTSPLVLTFDLNVTDASDGLWIAVSAPRQSSSPPGGANAPQEFHIAGKVWAGS